MNDAMSAYDPKQTSCHVARKAGFGLELSIVVNQRQ